MTDPKSADTTQTSELYVPSDFTKDGIISFEQWHTVQRWSVADTRWDPSLRALWSSSGSRGNCSWGRAVGWSLVPTKTIQPHHICKSMYSAKSIS